MHKESVTRQASSAKRVTFVIPAAVDQGIELYCAGTGKLKNEVAVMALAEFIQTRQADMMKILEQAIENAKVSATVPN